MLGNRKWFTFLFLAYFSQSELDSSALPSSHQLCKALFSLVNSTTTHHIRIVKDFHYADKFSRVFRSTTLPGIVPWQWATPQSHDGLCAAVQGKTEWCTSKALKSKQKITLCLSCAITPAKRLKGALSATLPEQSERFPDRHLRGAAAQADSISDAPGDVQFKSTWAVSSLTFCNIPQSWPASPICRGCALPRCTPLRRRCQLSSLKEAIAIRLIDPETCMRVPVKSLVIAAWKTFMLARSDLFSRHRLDQTMHPSASGCSLVAC